MRRPLPFIPSQFRHPEHWRFLAEPRFRRVQEIKIMSKKKKQKEKQQKKSYREQKLPGWMEDAEVLDIHRKAPMIRTISEVVYSQIIGKREARQLRMTVLIPDTGAAKPAVLFFPGGGWLGAAKDRFAENRWALAEAGFVVATAEYRTIPAGFPAQVVDGKTALRFLRAHAADFEIDTDRIDRKSVV